MINTNDIWLLVKSRLRLQDDALKELTETYIDEIGWRIKNYCRIGVIPEGLKYTWASMVIDALQAEQTTVDEIEETIAAAQNIKIGDTSISPAKESGGVSKQAMLDGIILNYTVDLNRYRRPGLIKW